MKNIGIVGGLGPESTLDYYKEIISTFNNSYPESPYPEIIIRSTDIKKLMILVSNQEWEALSDWLLEKIVSLHQAGADFVAIASNTPHIVFDSLKNRSPVPLLSIIEATCEESQSMGLKNIGLLGTKFTMEADFYKTPFIAKNISVSVPAPEEQEFIHHKLMSEVELGVIKQSTKNELLAIVKKMVEKDNIDGLVLGCTELPLILTESKFGIPFLNTTSIHCRKIVSKYLDKA